MEQFEACGKKIGQGAPVFFIAEVGINHDGSLELAKKHVDAAAQAGADSVKFQVFSGDRMYVPQAGEYEMMGKKMSVLEVVKQGEFKPEWLPVLKKHAEQKGLVFFASVFAFEDVDLMQEHGVGMYKIASYDLTNLPLFKRVAATGKPVLFSVGGGNLSEIGEAARTLRSNGCKQFGIFQCVAEYPAPREDSNLAVIELLKKAFDCPAGLSDHSFKPDVMEVPLAAVAAGAQMIEKHFTLSRELPGPDHKFAIEPLELKQLIEKARKIEARLKKGERMPVDPVLLGSAARVTYEREKYVRGFAYKALFAASEIRKGERFTEQNIAILRPGKSKPGIEPKNYFALIENGARAARGLKKFEPITWDAVFSTK